VVSLWSFVFHNLVGRRRLAFAPAYLLGAPFSLAAAAAPRALDAYPWLRGALGAALLAALLLGFFVDAAVLPLHPPRAPAAPSGPCADVAHLDLPLEGGGGAYCNVRVFYPAAVAAEGGAEPGPPYFKDGGECAAGLAHFMQLPAAVFAWIRHLPPWTVEGDRARAPLALEAALAAAGAAGLLLPPGGGGGGGGARLPVAVFSHGLAGTPDMYSNTIAELVSHGVVVFAPEHADGSAAFTRVRDGTALPYARLSPAEAKDRVLEHRRRHGQLKARALEVQACLDLADALAEAPTAHAPPPRRGEPAAPAPELLLARALLGGRLQRRAAVCVGHSFGGATAVAAAARDARVRAVAALDAWAFPFSAPLVARGVPQAPVLCLQGQGFSMWRENATALRLLLEPAFRAAQRGEAAAALGVSGSNGVLKGGALAPGMGALCDSGSEGGGGGGGGGDDDGGGAAAVSNAPSLAAAAAATVLATSPTANSAPAAALPPSPRSARGAGGSALPPPDIGVHPGSALLGLRDVYHQSFSDFGVLAPAVMRRMGMIGAGRRAEEEVRLIHAVTMAFLRHAAKGGRAPFSYAHQPWASQIYPHDGAESTETGR
jgi:dienelactone hydrolase